MSNKFKQTNRIDSTIDGNATIRGWQQIINSFLYAKRKREIKFGTESSHTFFQKNYTANQINNMIVADLQV